jgi:lipoyl(octanoyl) transferase
MDIEIKKSIKPVNYFEAIDLLESRLKNIAANKEKELIWILEHPEVFTAGTSYKENEIIDKSIDLLKTNRGGKITYHGPGQLICYFVIDLREKKDIRKFITTIENTIIKSLKKYNIETFPDKKNIGIWYKDKNEIQKVA